MKKWMLLCSVAALGFFCLPKQSQAGGYYYSPGFYRGGISYYSAPRFSPRVYNDGPRYYAPPTRYYRYNDFNRRNNVRVNPRGLYYRGNNFSFRYRW